MRRQRALAAPRVCTVKKRCSGLLVPYLRRGESAGWDHGRQKGAGAAGHRRDCAD